MVSGHPTNPNPPPTRSSSGAASAAGHPENGHGEGAAPHRQVAARLRTAGVRYTTARRLVVEALAGGEGPKTAADLGAELEGEVPVSSLYRTLTVLADAEILERHHDPTGVTRFELAEWLAGHHHHVVCVDCGRVEDVPLDAGTERMLEQVASRAADAAGFHPVGHRVDIEGRCGECRPTP